MDLPRLAISNCLGGGYAAAAAGRVSGGRGCAELGEFFGLALAAIRRRLDVGAESVRAEVGGRCLPTSRRILENGGFPWVSRWRSGDVARRVVARLGQVAERKAFFPRRPQIANLTTGAARRGSATPWGPIGSAAATPRFPLSGRAPSPQPRSVRSGPEREIFSKEAASQRCALERPSPGAGISREVHLPQMGSGVWVAPSREASGVNRAESIRQAVGQGEVRAHEPLDVGEAAMLRPIDAAVNGFAA